MNEFETLILDTLKRLVTDAGEAEVRVYSLMHESSRMAGYDRLNSRFYSDMEKALFSLRDSGLIALTVYPLPDNRVTASLPVKREVYEESGYKDSLIIGY